MTKKDELSVNGVAELKAILIRLAGRLEVLEALWETIPQTIKERLTPILDATAALGGTINGLLDYLEHELNRETRQGVEEAPADSLATRRLRDLVVEQFGVPFVDLDVIQIDPDVAKLIPADIAHKYQLIVFEKTAGASARLKLAMTDPMNLFGVDDVKFHTGLQVEVYVTDQKALDRALDKHYRRQRHSAPG